MLEKLPPLPRVIPISPSRLQRKSHSVNAVVVSARITTANGILSKSEGCMIPPVLFLIDFPNQDVLLPA